MSATTILLPDEVKRIAEDRAAAAGYADTSSYVQALILADAAEPVDAALEAHLLRAMDTPARPMTPADWDEKRKALNEAKP